MTKAQNKLLIVILFGWFGIHKFMEKNSTMGWIYLFTCGLFGIGWIVDIAKALFDVINENTNASHSPYTESRNTTTQKTTYSPPVSNSLKTTTSVNSSITIPSRCEKFDYPTNKTFLFVDVETATHSNDTICAIGAIVVKNNVATSLYSLINPHTHITNTSIHGIDDDDVVDAPVLSEFWTRISNLIGDDFIVIGHNVAFDISVLSKDLERYGINFSATRKIDTMAVAKDILYNYSTQAGDLKLDTICQRLNIRLNHHNAESDILATKQVLEMLLNSKNRNITDFINVHHSSAKDNFIGNVKKVGTQRYWDDIHAGRTPVYFTNWNNITYECDPKYDEVELSVLQSSSMMDRSSCGIPRIVKQVELIKKCIETISGKIYGKGAKKANCYIEFYYMDVSEYQKLKAQGYKIYHALDVEKFILENTELIQKYGLEQSEAALKAIEEKERLARERDERRAQREARKLEPKEPPKKTTRRVAQMDDTGEVLRIFESLTDAVKTTGTNSKSIRDCCNGVQKHAGGYVWKYLNDETDIEETE